MIWHKSTSEQGDDGATGSDPLAQAAADGLESGMNVGLGGGRTASRATREIAARVSAGALVDIKVIPASEAVEKLCLELGLSVMESSTFGEIDLLIDGADEVDREMRMLKGSRGAVTRERIVAHASRRRVYMVPEDKVSESLGSASALALALLPFGVSSTREALRRLGISGVLRPEMDGELLVTDNANLILDARLPEGTDLEGLAHELNGVPGVVDHGLFLDEADELIIEREDGTIERLIRSD